TPAIVNLPKPSAEATASSSLAPQDQIAEANTAGEYRTHDREVSAELRPGQHPHPPGGAQSNRRSRAPAGIGDQDFRDLQSGGRAEPVRVHSEELAPRPRTDRLGARIRQSEMEAARADHPRQCERRSLSASRPSTMT